MGYFKKNYEMAKPVFDEDDFDYMFLGIMALLSPIGVPLYYIGKIIHWVMNDG